VPEKSHQPLDLLLSVATQGENFMRKALGDKRKSEFGVVKKAILKDGYIYLAKNEDNQKVNENEAIKLKYKPRSLEQVFNGSKDSKYFLITFMEKYRLAMLILGKKEDENNMEIVKKLKNMFKKLEYKKPAIKPAIFA